MTKFKISYTIIVEDDSENPKYSKDDLLDIFFDNQVGNIDESIKEDLGISIVVIEE